MLIFRYLNREIILTLLAVTLILLLIFVSNQFVRYLGAVADGRLAFWVFMRLVAIEIPHLLVLLLPLSLYIAILLSFGRLYADNEITVMQAAGMSRKQLLYQTLPIALVVATIVGILTLWLSPIIVHYRDQLLAQMGETSLQTLLPGQFQSGFDGNRVFYVAHMSVDRKNLDNIFVAEKNRSASVNGQTVWTVLSANRGYQMVDPKTGDLFLVTTDGHRYEGVPGTSNYQMVDYEKYGIRIEQNYSADTHTNFASMSTYFLTQLFIWPLYVDKKPVMAELQWRLSLPLSAILLTILAVPLSRVKPRQGKYANLIPAILFYIVYANLLFVSRTWVEKGTLHGLLGMWWVHILLLLVASIFLLNDYQKKRILNWLKH